MGASTPAGVSKGPPAGISPRGVLPSASEASVFLPIVRNTRRRSGPYQRITEPSMRRWGGKLPLSGVVG